MAKHQRLFAFEGINGAGKSALIERVAAKLREEKYALSCYAQPGATMLGHHIRTALEQGRAHNTVAKYLLFLADRIETTEQHIIPDLQANKVVLLDRHIDSAFVYNAMFDKVDEAFVQQSHAQTEQAIPHTVFLIDVSGQCGASRMRRTDRSVAAEVTQLEQLRQYYLQRVQAQNALPCEARSAYIVVNGEFALDTVVATVHQHIKQALLR